MTGRPLRLLTWNIRYDWMNTPWMRTPVTAQKVLSSIDFQRADKGNSMVGTSDKPYRWP